MELTKEIVLDPILPREEQEKFFLFLKNVIKDGKRSSCVIYGPGTSGKSTLACVARQVVGSENCMFVPGNSQKDLYTRIFGARVKAANLGIIIQDRDDDSTIETVVRQQKNKYLPKHMIMVRAKVHTDIDYIDRDGVIIHCSLAPRNISRNISYQMNYDPAYHSYDGSVKPKLTLIQEILSLIEKIE